LTTAIVYSFAVQAGLPEPPPGWPAWAVVARQLPRLAVALLNERSDSGVRFLPLMGYDGTQRRFFTIDTLPSERLAIGMHCQEPPPRYVVDGCLQDSGVRLRILVQRTGEACFDEVVPFSVDKPAQTVSRLLFELGGALGWSGGPPAVPRLSGAVWADYFAGADDLLALEADLLRHSLAVPAALRAVQAAPAELLVRRMFLQLAVRAAALAPSRELADGVDSAARAVLRLTSGAPRVEFVAAAAGLLEQLGDGHAAFELRTALAQAEPDDADALRGAAIVWQQRGDLARSVPVLERLVELGHRTPQTVAMLAAACLRSGDRARHAQLVEELLALPVLPAAAARTVAVWLIDRGRGADALRVIDAALRDESEHAGLWLARGQVLLALADGPPARVALQRCIDLTKDDGQRREARRLLRFADVPELLAAMREVDAALVAGDAARAMPRVKELVRGRPQIAEAWLFLGVVQQRRGKPRRAMRALQRALRLDAGLGEAHDRLGVLLVRAGRHERALEHLQEAARCLPDASGPKLHIAQVYAHLGRLQEGQRSLQDAERLGASQEQVAAVRRAFFAAPAPPPA
jgi:tetratricopeptide (TPR) repeat protein